MKPNTGVSMFAFKKVKLVLCWITEGAYLLVLGHPSSHNSWIMILFLPNPENYFQDTYVSQGWDFAIIFVPLSM